MGRPTKPALPDTETVRMPLDLLLPADYNPRRISDRAMKGLRASLERFGELGGIVYNKRTGRLVGGHQRVKALAAMGIKDAEVRVVDLPIAEEKAANLALNHPGIGGEWDDALLAVVLDEIKRDLPTAFEELQLADIIADAGLVNAADGGTDGLTDPDDVPEELPDPVTRAGDVWVMGAHRIICGDSTDAATVGRLLGDVKPHLMVTDPPYGVEYDATWRVAAMPEKNTGKDGGGTHGKVMNDDRADWREAWALFPGEVAYVWHASSFSPEVIDSLEACNFVRRNLIVWGKSVFAIGRGDYHHKHEPCWYAVRKGGTGHWQGDRTQSTLWAIDKPQKSETGHSTQKPIECMRKPIENNSAPGDAVYEPFSGSGTTIIAGEQTGRRVYAVELNPPYVDIAVTRWQAFTGKDATLDGDGRTFAEITAERAGHGATE